MTTFKNFRNRAHQRTDESGPLSANSNRGDGPPPVRHPSNATELGPQHMEILRQIEAEGEPLSLAEELADLAEHGDEEAVDARLEKLNKQAETHIAELTSRGLEVLVAAPIHDAAKVGLAELAGLASNRSA